MQFVQSQSPLRRVARELRRKADDAKRQVGMKYNNLEAQLFDVQNGTNTRGKTPFHELDVTGDSVAHGTGYQAVNAGHFTAAIDALDIPAGSTFIDIGCGKGKALLLASRNPKFAHVIGVEMAKSLCDIAEENAKIYAKRYPAASRIQVACEDATRYDIPDDANVIFMNNPFDAILTRSFLENLKRSLLQSPRKMWLLYGNPMHAAEIESSEIFAYLRICRFFGPGRDIKVYASSAARAR